MAEKIYLETEVRFYPDGKLEPLSYVWEGKKIPIEKVLGVSLMFSDGAGARYACLAEGRQMFLYFVVNRWYMKVE